LRAGGFGLLDAVAEVLARALVDHHRNHRESGSRSSRVNDGFARASTIMASASARTTQPRLRTKRAAPPARPQQLAPHNTQDGTSGAKLMPKPTMRLIVPTIPAAPAREPVGLVVAASVHHDVDAGAEGEPRWRARPARAALPGYRCAPPRRRQNRLS
jgi:hypothetical protein